MTVEERLSAHLAKTPDIAQANWIASNATVVGDVTLGPKSSVFYGAVLRGDIARIVVGEGSNIQDNCVVHLADDLLAVDLVQDTAEVVAVVDARDAQRRRAWSQVQQREVDAVDGRPVDGVDPWLDLVDAQRPIEADRVRRGRS